MPDFPENSLKLIYFHFLLLPATLCFYLIFSVKILCYLELFSLLISNFLSSTLVSKFGEF